MRKLLVMLLVSAGVVGASTTVLASANSGFVARSGAARGKVRVPSLVHKKLPLAEYLLKGAGLGVGKEDCDCTFGVVIKSDWYVCVQTPRAGSLVARGARVGIYSARDPSDC